MIFSQNSYENKQLNLEGKVIKYLGSILTDTLDPEVEIRCRIERNGNNNFPTNESLFCDDNLNIKLRQRMVNCFIWSVLIYEVECRTLKIGSIYRLEAFEMWIHRRMLGVLWTDLPSNDEVLRRARVKRQIMVTIEMSHNLLTSDTSYAEKSIIFSS